MGKVTNIRVAPEQDEEPKEHTAKQQEQLAFKNGNRRTRRTIAKRNKFFKDRSGEVWRKSNEMIRTPRDGEINL